VLSERGRHLLIVVNITDIQNCAASTSQALESCRCCCWLYYRSLIHCTKL